MLTGSGKDNKIGEVRKILSREGLGATDSTEGDSSDSDSYRIEDFALGDRRHVY